MKLIATLCGFSLITLLSLTGAARGQGREANPELALRSLSILEQDLREASSPDVKKSTARKILEVGAPLARGTMSFGFASGVARSLKERRELHPAQKGYFGFWLLRAVASIHADSRDDGEEAGQILHTLGATESKKQFVLDIMAALKLKGWLSTNDPRRASMDAPFQNTLGMKFVPAGTANVLFSIWETRREDYATFAAENQGISSKWQAAKERGAPAGHVADHPAVNMGREDAVKFCDWLTARERKRGLLERSQRYRLPADLEWSAAARIGKEQGGSPALRHYYGNENKVGFIWGNQWPPPAGTGNFGDKTAVEVGSIPDGISGYNDGYATTAPVGSFAANPYGLYDLAGNVWEFCDGFRGTTYANEKAERWPSGPFARGGSFEGRADYTLRYSIRAPGYEDLGSPLFGFRCVLVVDDR